MRLPKIHNHSRAINIANCEFGWNPQTEQLEIYEQSREITLIEKHQVGSYMLWLKHKPSFWKKTLLGDYITFSQCHYRAHAQILGSTAEFSTSTNIEGSIQVLHNVEQWIVRVYVKRLVIVENVPTWEDADAPLAVDIWDNESPAARYYTGGNGG